MGLENHDFHLMVLLANNNNYVHIVFYQYYEEGGGGYGEGEDNIYDTAADDEPQVIKIITSVKVK